MENREESTDWRLGRDSFSDGKEGEDIVLSIFRRAMAMDIEPFSSSFRSTADAAEYVLFGEAVIRE